MPGPAVVPLATRTFVSVLALGVALLASAAPAAAGKAVSSLPDGRLRQLGRFLADDPWIWAIVIGLLLVGAAWFVRSRFRFIVQRRT